MMKQSEDKKIEKLQTMIFTGILVAVFVLLIRLVWPDGCFYGSTTDWYNQHVTLAETIRNMCMQERTLAPSWISLGGGSNGFQFAYYGYYRPDIIIGCLFPQIPMTVLIPVYALSSYLAAVLLMQLWLRMKGMTPYAAFFGSMLFLLAGCFFQTHRQIMFVNYMPFLLLALIFLEKRRFALMSISLTLIYLHSFYYAIACLAVIGWFAVGMLRKEDVRGRRHLLFQGVTSVILSLGMAMMLLLPTFMTILEHKHSGEKATTWVDLVMPNIKNLLYDPYGLGLTLLCLYLLVLGLRVREVRWQCALLLVGSLFGVASYVLNATLYARGKILMPFVPVVIYYCMQVFQKIRKGETQWRLWPLLIFAVIMLTQRNQEWFAWVTLDGAILLTIVLVDLILRKHAHLTEEEEERQSLYGTGMFRYIGLFVMPFFIYLGAAAMEGWQGIPNAEASQASGVNTEQTMSTDTDQSLGAGVVWHTGTENGAVSDTDTDTESEQFTEEELQAFCGNRLYRCDKLTDTKKECNALLFYGQQSANMYSSVTNPLYQNFYYNVVKMPIQINNRTALLEERNPLFAQLMGERYILTTENKMPSGYSILQQKGRYVIAENTDVLPIAYTTADCISDKQFASLDDMEKMTALSRYTVVENDRQKTVKVSEMDEIALPGLDAQQSANMYSSVTNPLYQNFYYNVVKMPIQINNRTALLEERNPLFAQLMGERYILTTENKMPSGYSILQQKGRYVIAENTDVLPIAYTTADCISDKQFASLDDMEKMTALSRYTVVENDRQKTVKVSEMDEIALPGLDAEEVSRDKQIQVTPVKKGYRITATESGVLRIPLDPDMENGTLYFRFQLENHTADPVVISANGRRNKLSGLDAPYPNENNVFSYMLKEKGRDKYISLKLSAGTYDLTDIACYRFPTTLFQKKQVQSATLLPEEQWNKNSVLSCAITAGEDGYFITSIPMQNGLKLYVDGKVTKLEKVNTAFAGAKVTAGTHTVDLQFEPPGQRYGIMASLLSVILFGIWAAGTAIRNRTRE